jgi:hypothetical protein
MPLIIYIESDDEGQKWPSKDSVSVNQQCRNDGVDKGKGKQVQDKL